LYSLKKIWDYLNDFTLKENKLWINVLI
jgi:hypothetical protein